MLSRIERAMPGLPTPAPVVAPPAAPESREQRRSKLNAAWRFYLQGRHDDRIPEYRDLISTVSGQGGAVVPVEFSGFLSESLKLYAPLFDYANVRQSSNGRSAKITKVDDTTHGLTLITEGSVSLSEADPTFSSNNTRPQESAPVSRCKVTVMFEGGTNVHSLRRSHKSLSSA